MSRQRYSVNVKIITNIVQGKEIVIIKKIVIMHQKRDTISLIFGAVTAAKSGNKLQHRRRENYFI